MPWKIKPLEIYQHPDVDYFLFIDESGEPQLNNYNKKNPVFTVAGVCIKKEDYADVKKSMDSLKEQYWNKGFFKYKNRYERKVCLVSRKIRRRNEAFSKHYLNDAKYDAFLKDLSTCIENLQFKIVASCINKDSLLQAYSNPIPAYNLALTFIIERFSFFLKSQNKTGIIVLESRGKKEDGELLEACLHTYNNGTLFINGNNIRNSIHGFYFNKKWNVQSKNSDTFIGLELADLVAHPIAHFALKGDKSLPFQIIESKFLGYQNYIGKGLKIFP